ncbi:MAG: ATP-binding protein [Bacteroidota bacterium]|nr:ATP-binding protein [Bacteroidota bacterium]
MRDVTQWELSLYITALPTLVSIVALLWVPMPWWLRVVLLLIIFLITLSISSYLTGKFFFNRIEKINSQIIDSIKNERFKSKMQSTPASVLDKLNLSVRKLLRDKAIEIDNLKELERLRKEFLGDVAHELRSPIFNIQGYLHTLLEGALEDEEVSTKFLQKAAKHADLLSSLVEDLVTITRIEAGELKLEKSEFNIKDLISEVTELLELSARVKNIHLNCRFEKDPPVMVLADRTKIRQVLINLVGNSIKYGREAGLTSLNIQQDLAHRQITVEVSDNGEGIAEEHLPRIFERFYRVDKSRSRSQPSTGLGLAIVKHFIEAHKQRIYVTSRESVGSLFSFTLDREPELISDNLG